MELHSTPPFMWWPRWKRDLGENGYMYMFG